MQKNVGIALVLGLVVVIVGLIIATQSSPSGNGHPRTDTDNGWDPITDIFSPCDAENKKLKKMNKEYLTKLKNAKQDWLEKESGVYQMLSLVEAESDASANEIRDAILDGTTCKPGDLTRCENATEELITKLGSEIPNTIWTNIEFGLREVVTGGLVEFQQKCLAVKTMDQISDYSYLDGPHQEAVRQRCKRLTRLKTNIKKQQKKLKQDGC